MVEAYKDLEATPYDHGFLGWWVSVNELKGGFYKYAVGQKSRLPQLDSCNVIVFNQVLLQNIEKASFLAEIDYEQSDPLCRCGELAQGEILAAQSMLLETRSVVSVLCTRLWFVIDYRPQAMRRYMQSAASQG